MFLNEVRILSIEKSQLVAGHLLLNHGAFNYKKIPQEKFLLHMCCAYIVVTKLTDRGLCRRFKC